MSKDNFSDIRNSPTTALQKARQRWFEEYGAAGMNSNRMFVGLMASLITNISLGIALAVMMPLKTVQPWMVKVDKEEGVATATKVGTAPYQPGDPEKRYFLAEWTTMLLTLDKYMTEKNLVKAFYRTRGKGSSEFGDWVDVNKPAEALKLDPSLTRNIQIRSISFVADGAALVRVSLETRTSAQSSPIRKNVIATIHFAVIPPTTEQEILENPIGLYITHFAISEDMN